jgi:ABC-type transport system involved in cytochrome bd biosynthesis fused ATPase/permease subunit
MAEAKKSSGRVLTPLWVISLFVSLTEITLGAVTTQTSGGVQIALTAFVVVFPLLIAGCFFAVLYSKPWVFYSPREYTGIDAATFIEALQGKSNKLVTKTEDLSDRVTTFGRPDRFQLLFKAKGLTWKKSTKVMEVLGGCVVQVSSEQMNLEGSWSIAEALTFVPGVRVLEEQTGTGRYLSPITPESGRAS